MRQVRGPRYGLTKQKIHSLDSLYTCIAVDVYTMPHPEPGLAHKFVLPEVRPSSNRHKLLSVLERGCVSGVQAY